LFYQFQSILNSNTRKQKLHHWFQNLWQAYFTNTLLMNRINSQETYNNRRYIDEKPHSRSCWWM
jgi:hypothetical protein